MRNVVGTYIVKVHIRQGTEQLTHHVLNKAHCQRLLALCDSIEELAAVQKFHDNENVGGVKIIFINLDHIDMIYFNQQLDFFTNLRN